MGNFNQTKYIQEYRKQHKAQFCVDLNKEEMEILNQLLKVTGQTKVGFLRDALERECKKHNIPYKKN